MLFEGGWDNGMTANPYGRQSTTVEMFWNEVIYKGVLVSDWVSKVR